MSPPKRKVYVFIVSDATGLTAERVISAVLVQFKPISPIFKRFPYIKRKDQIENVLARAEKLEAIVIYSLVSQELRAWISEEKVKRQVYTIDLLGPLLERMGRLWNMLPAFRPGLFKGLGEESIRLAESIDFTLRHDDGQGIETLGRADLILLGVSRTSKTPTSLYLSCNNSLKVANVPIIPEVNPPKKIFTLKRRKVGLIIAPDRLAFIREKRLKYAGETDYTDINRIREELAHCQEIFKQINGIEVVDVTNASIEEIANKIV
ncbi:MAG: pyruvate, water dikinase regulatory protein [Thermodesulfobacteriota bacterium]|nr:pyruvate, water dikinase regulatory protein [Thermodesulfobacteriota bacterium]